MHPLADLDFGGPEQLVVRLGDQQPGHAQGLFFSLLEDEGGELLGFGLLFGGQTEVAHEVLRVRRGGGFSTPIAVRLYATNNPPTFQLPTLKLMPPAIFVDFFWDSVT